MTFRSRLSARRHFQEHIEYYPIVCNHCGISCTDLAAFERHLLKRHPERPLNGSYLKSFRVEIDDWIDSFLFAQLQLVKTYSFCDFCPVCVRLQSIEPTWKESRKQQTSTLSIGEKINHVYRHLCYLPFECSECQQTEGKQYAVAYFDTNAHCHVKQKHFNLSSKDFDLFFKKNVTISKLDDLIVNYLKQVNIDLDHFFSVHHHISDYFDCFKLEQVNQLDQSVESNELETNVSVLEQLLCCNERLTDYPDLQNSSEDDSKSNEPIEEKTNELKDKMKTFLVIRSPANTVQPVPQPKPLIVPPSPLVKQNEKFVNKVKLFLSNNLICIFCVYKFGDRNEYWRHVQTHYSNFVKSPYDLYKNDSINNWLDYFIKFQKQNRIKVLECECAYHCPFCWSVHQASSYRPLECDRNHHSVSFFEEHIYRHLCYPLYKCLICDLKSKNFQIHRSQRQTDLHLKEQHQITAINSSVINQYFRKCVQIPMIENLITERIDLYRKCSQKSAISPSNQIVLASTFSTFISTSTSESKSFKPTSSFAAQSQKLVISPRNSNFRTLSAIQANQSSLIKKRKL